MENNIVTRSNNSYLYSERYRMLTLLHPKLADIIMDTNKSLNKTITNEYYETKYNYLKKYKLIESSKNSNSDKHYFSDLKQDDILNALTNTRQLIFEVSDKCNLNCFYCGYGELYNNYDERVGINMDINIFYTTIKYMYSLWQRNDKTVSRDIVRISFYGGEPLLNIKFIKDAVKYLEDNPCDGKKFIFTMTTNGILLKKHIKFLVSKNFEILISIDGNARNNSYRIDCNGNDIFKKLHENILYIKSEYPEYFNKNINFNTVLHDRNSIEEASLFLYQEFNKIPQINELNIFGVCPEKKSHFNKLFKSKVGSQQAINKTIGIYSFLEQKSPQYIDAAHFFNKSSHKQFNKSIQQLINLENRFLDNIQVNRVLPTSTCIPFSRKVFISVKGKLYPCERIGNEYDFGNVTTHSFNINYIDIAKMYNCIFKHYIRLCSKCDRKTNCSVCIMSDVKGYEVCAKMYNTSHLNQYLSDIICLIEEKPSHYREFINEINFI